MASTLPPSPSAPPPVSAPAADEPPGLPSWPAWTAPVALLAALAAALVGAGLIGLVAALAGADVGDGDTPPEVVIAGTLVQDLALIGAALFFARLAGRPRPAQFGLRAVSLKRGLRALVLAWVAFVAFSAVWAAALGIEESDDLPEELGVDRGAVALAAVAVLVCVVAPVVEEFFFRGFFFTAVRTWRGPWPAAVITGAFFGGIHAGSASVEFLVPLAFFGFVLCVLYWRTGSLYPCIALHSLNNALALGVNQGWSWQIPLLMLGANAAIAATLIPAVRAWRRTERPLLA